jgi:uncharacterized protein
MTNREQAAAVCNTQPELCREILRCEVGSSAHGVNLEGTDDFDMMAIGIERPEHVLGTSQFEHYIYRTAEVREGKKGVPSQPGDIDLTVYSLRKFARLAAQGNPSVLLMLYAPAMKADVWGKALRASHQIFQSKKVGDRFLGYMTAQKEKLKGERGQMRTTREALIKEHGYDTKYSMHVLRLGYQGVKYMETGAIECPIEGPMRNFLLGVRRGRQAFEAVLQLAEQYEHEIETALAKSDFREEPDYDRINSHVSAIYRDVWEYEAL